MLKYIQRFFFLIDQEFRIKVFFLTLIILILATFEVLSIGAIIPFINSILSDKNFLGIYLQKTFNIDSYNLVTISLIFILFVFIIKNIFFIFFCFFQSRLASNIRKKLSEKLFVSYLNIDYKFFLKKNSSEFIKNINIECENFRYTLFVIISFFSEIIIFFFIISFLFFFNPFISFFIFFSLLTFYFVYNFFFKNFLRKQGDSRYENLENLFKIVSETLTSLKEIKVLGVKNNFLNKFNIFNYKYSESLTFYEFFLNMPKALVELIGVIGIVSIIFINLENNFSTSNLMTTLGVYGLASFRILPCLNRILLGYNHIKISNQTINSLFFSLNEINSNMINKDFILHHKENILTIDNIKIVNLNFTYGDKDKFLIDNINLEIKKNSFVGLVGNSGSGKSTLINIIVGLLKPDNGAVYYNEDINIFNNLRYFYKKISYVPQEVNIIDDTIKNNIAFGVEKNKIDIKKLNKSIDDSKLNSFIETLGKGLETILGDKGSRLSGGQKQRIGIARALYFNPDLIIFDESTSSLDKSTENEIINTINELKGKKTIIFATHQMPLLEKCDTIVKISENKLKILK
jgi:ABC-type bacteriocin/lantibiotic exporter with double-glycine peptidase domain